MWPGEKEQEREKLDLRERFRCSGEEGDGI